MAQSRLEKIGTIFTRVTGLLRSGAMKPEDKPLWYDVYAAFPPKLEPRFDRPAPNIPIRNIFYAEDVVRAKYHKSERQGETINLNEHKRETQTQQFINIYNELRAQGALDDDQIFATAQEVLKERRSQLRGDLQSADLDSENVQTESSSPSLVQSFKQATQNQGTQSTPPSKKPSKQSSIDIENLFKD